MEEKGWKIIAGIFIILFIAETIFLLWMYSLGTNSLENENICAYNICGDDPYYQYFDYGEVCECYDADMNVIKQEYLG